jgi:hypothetical protein
MSGNTNDTAHTPQPIADVRDRRMPGIAPSPSRAWPRCEAGYTHYELGASTDSDPTAVMAQRYTPRIGVREE